MRFIFEDFYRSSFNDPRLKRLKVDKSILNLPLLVLSQHLSHSESMLKKIEGGNSPYVFKTPELISESGIRDWIKAQGGWILDEGQLDPLDFFHRSFALSHWVLLQRLRHQSGLDIRYILESMTFDNVVIQKSLEEADRWIQNEIKQLAKTLATAYWIGGFYSRHRLQALIEESVFGEFLSELEKQSLLTFLEESKHLYGRELNSWIDQIIQFFQAIFSCDRVSKVKKKLDFYFFQSLNSSTCTRFCCHP
jgi:hypothetical protein